VGELAARMAPEKENYIFPDKELELHMLGRQGTGRLPLLSRRHPDKEFVLGDIQTPGN
jgi:hypothetical protein